MKKWNAAEVAKMEVGGNKEAGQKWLANFHGERPPSGDEKRIHTFIEDVFKNKKYLDPKAGEDDASAAVTVKAADAASSASAAAARPAKDVDDAPAGEVTPPGTGTTPVVKVRDEFLEAHSRENLREQSDKKTSTPPGHAVSEQRPESKAPAADDPFALLQPDTVTSTTSASVAGADAGKSGAGGNPLDVNDLFADGSFGGPAGAAKFTPAGGMAAPQPQYGYYPQGLMPGMQYGYVMAGVPAGFGPAGMGAMGGGMPQQWMGQGMMMQPGMRPMVPGGAGMGPQQGYMMGSGGVNVPAGYGMMPQQMMMQGPGGMMMGGPGFGPQGGMMPPGAAAAVPVPTSAAKPASDDPFSGFGSSGVPATAKPSVPQMKPMGIPGAGGAGSNKPPGAVAAPPKEEWNPFT